MVRQIKRIVCLLCVCLLLITCVGKSAKAIDDELYQEEINPDNIPTAVLNMYRDILPKLSFNDDYVLFRSNDGENVYKMIVGDLKYEDGFIYAESDCTLYRLVKLSYNSPYELYIMEYGPYWKVASNGEIIYSNLGNFSDLISLEVKYEILISLLLLIALFMFFVFRVFTSRKC